MTKTSYDRVYWWNRGTQQWMEAIPGVRAPYSSEPPKTAEELRAEIRRKGYVAHLGLRSVGAPEGAPSAAQLAEVLR